MRYAMLAFLIAFSATTFGETKPEWWLINGAWSHHFEENEYGGKYNEEHGAIGFQYKKDGFMVGGADLTNGDSYGEDAAYLGFGAYASNGLQIMLAAIQHSAVRDGETTPMLLPSYSLDYKRLGVNIYYVPFDANTVAVEFKMRLF